MKFPKKIPGYPKVKVRRVNFTKTEYPTFQFRFWLPDHPMKIVQGVPEGDPKDIIKKAVEGIDDFKNQGITPTEVIIVTSDNHKGKVAVLVNDPRQPLYKYGEHPDPD